MPRPQNMELWRDGYHRLIDAVKTHKALYSKFHPLYNSKRHKLQLWHCVCKEIVPDWDQMSVGERGEKLTEVQRGWKTVRDGFNRELALKRQEKKKKLEGGFFRKRKTYGYFHDLLFLLEGKEEIDLDELEDPLESDDYTEDTIPDEMPVEINLDNERKRPLKEEMEFDCESEIIQVKKAKTVNNEEDKNDEVDDDKHFCLSLVPTFRKLTDKQKLEARIAMLQVLGDVRFRNDCGGSNDST